MKKILALVITISLVAALFAGAGTVFGNPLWGIIEDDCNIPMDAAHPYVVDFNNVNRTPNWGPDQPHTGTEGMYVPTTAEFDDNFIIFTAGAGRVIERFVIVTSVFQLSPFTIELGTSPTGPFVAPTAITSDDIPLNDSWSTTRQTVNISEALEINYVRVTFPSFADGQTWQMMMINYEIHWVIPGADHPDIIESDAVVTGGAAIGAGETEITYTLTPSRGATIPATPSRVIVVAYSGNRAIRIAEESVRIVPAGNELEITMDTTGADRVKIFIFDNDGGIRPVAATVEIN